MYSELLHSRFRAIHQLCMCLLAGLFNNKVFIFCTYTPIVLLLYMYIGQKKDKYAMSTTIYTGLKTEFSNCHAFFTGISSLQGNTTAIIE